MQRLSPGPAIESDVLERMFSGVVYQLDAGDAASVPTAGATRMAIKLGAGATLRWSPVDTEDASAHDTDHQTDVTVHPAVAAEISWPFHRIEAIGGTVRVAFLP